jgi:hypothetical protein
MADKQSTKRALMLQQRAARLMERGLPDQVRRAYGIVPIELSDLPSDDPQLVELRESARASLLKQGSLTDDELGTLSVDAAIETALRRLREQAASLKAQAAEQGSHTGGNQAAFGKAPRTLPRG